MSEADVKCQIRNQENQPKVKILRKQGIVPGIFYAHNEDSIPISVDAKQIQQLINREVNILNVIFPDGKTRKSIIRDIQRDPVTDAIIHLDFLGIKLTEKIKITIPIVLKGTPVGVKEGGILEHLLREVEVEGLPLDIPEHIEVDVSELNIGDSIKLQDINVEKIVFSTEIHHAVANVIHPKVITIEEEVAEEVLEEGEEKPAEEEETESEESKS
jgi:large subunit ribosomal protein L25